MSARALPSSFELSRATWLTLLITALSLVYLGVVVLTADELIAFSQGGNPQLNRSGISLGLLLWIGLFFEQALNLCELLVRHRDRRETRPVSEMARTLWVSRGNVSLAVFTALSLLVLVPISLMMPARGAIVGLGWLVGTALLWGGARLGLGRALGRLLRAPDRLAAAALRGTPRGQKVAMRLEAQPLTTMLIFLPGGRLLRLAIMLAVVAPVVLVKLLVYFVFFALMAPLHLLLERLLGWQVGKLFDVFDDLWEWPERTVNGLYNSLYFCKINPLSNAFTTCFNLTLPLWCLNH